MKILQNHIHIEKDETTMAILFVCPMEMLVVKNKTFYMPWNILQLLNWFFVSF